MQGEVTVVSNAIISSKTNELRMWLLVHAMLAVCFVAVLTSVDKPLQLVGMMLLIDLIMLLPVLYGFHEANCLERILRATGQDSGPSPYAKGQEPCGGMLGNGGTLSAFVAYITAFGLYTWTLFSFYAMCRFDSFKLRFTASNYMCFILAGTLVLVALFLLEIGKNSRMRATFV